MISRRDLLRYGASSIVSAAGLTATASAAGSVYPTGKAKVVVTKIAAGLDHPWSIMFLPSGTCFVTERAGRIRRILKGGILSPAVKGVPAVFNSGQGGLLDLVHSPNFKTNRLVFMSFAEVRAGGNGLSVARARLSEDLKSLTGLKVIWRQKPTYAGDKHFGSRLVFDRAGNLFVTTGERADLRDEAQNGGNTLGKVVRITPNGGIPAGNPKKQGWLPEIWSIGHRNMQGAALHPQTGALWTIEHGPQGGDELNHPQAGKNYGWPVITYGREYGTGAQIGEGTSKPGMEQPVKYWVPSIAPSGLCFYSGRKIPAWKGNLFAGALAGTHISRMEMSGSKVIAEEKLFQGLARIRDICESPSGYLYFITDDAGPNGVLYRISLAPA